LLESMSIPQRTFAEAGSPAGRFSAPKAVSVTPGAISVAKPAPAHLSSVRRSASRRVGSEPALMASSP